MFHQSKSIGQRYALCAGIGQYTELSNRNLRYAVSDAQAIAERLQDPQRGQFEVTLLTDPAHTTKQALEETIEHMLNGQHLNAYDLVVIYLSCHGNVYGGNNTFYLLPSNTRLEENGMPKKTTVIDIHDLAKILTGARVKNIIFLLDACYSGGVGGTFQYVNLDRDLTPDTNLFMIGAARHDQVTLQASRAQHGIFTSCLLRAFEQKPKRNDGWLTISDIHTFITEDIKIFEQEGTIQIQGVSAVVNPNIPFIKNPLYSSQSLEFCEEVRKLLQLVQYEPIEIDIPEGALTNFYVAEVKSGLRTSRVGIIPYYNQVEPLSSEYVESVASFVKAQVEEGNLDYGLLVTMLEVSHALRKSIRIRSLEILTYENIWKNLIDFKKYLRKLVRDYESSSEEDSAPLNKVYIHLNAEYREYELEASAAIERDLLVNPRTNTIGESGKGYRVTWRGDAEEIVQHWLTDPTSSRLALLADYGSGKTTFCQHLSATLARNYFESSTNRQHIYRLPLLIPLLDFSKVPVDLESYLVAYLKRRCNVDNPDFEALMKMAEAGLLLFMLDGFDEMASRANIDTMQQNIALFEKLASLPKNKVLLTTRPEYFMNLSQERSMLRSYPCLYLQLFNEKQVSLYLQKRVPHIIHHEGESAKDWEYYREQIDRIHDLSDLAQRPVFLEMIIKTLPVLIAKGEAVNRPNLYQRYLEGELDRQILKQRRDLQISRQKRFEIMEQVALELYRTNKAELTSNRILEVSRKLLTVEQQEEMEGSLREIVTCSFLIRKGDRYQFSHESFFEYLVARRLAKEITMNYLETFQLRPISWTIQEFLLEFERSILQKSLINSKTDTTAVTFDRTNLVNWFEAHPTGGWVSTNTISLLARLLPHDLLCKLPLKGADLNGANLSSANLSGANLREVNLSGADLNGANLSSANLSGANLYDADLSYANLNNAKLSDADLHEVNLSDADLNHADLRGANLKRAHLRGANLNHADLSGADLSSADLHEARLGYAKLNYVRLSYVDLRHADLFGAMLNGADLSGADLSGADLSGVNLRGIDLSLTKLIGAYLG